MFKIRQKISNLHFGPNVSSPYILIDYIVIKLLEKIMKFTESKFDWHKSFFKS